MGIYSDEFSKVFSTLLEKTGVSCYQISQYSHLDQAYLSRLKNGEKKNPSAETVVRIGMALAHCSDKVSLYDIDDLLKATGRSLFHGEKSSTHHHR